MEAFATSLEHVLAELEHVDLFLRLQVSHARHLRGTDDRFAGLYVSDQEIDAITSEPVGLPRWATAPRPWDESRVQRAFDDIATRAAERKAAGIERGVTFRLDRLVTLFGLDRFDVNALLVCLTPEIDLRYERLFAYLQDDVQKRRPTVDLVLNLLCPTLEAKLAARPRFTGSGALLAHRLIELFEDPSRPRATLLGKDVRVDPRIVAFLLGPDDLDPVIARHAALVPLPPRPRPTRGQEARRQSEAVATCASSGPVLVHVVGPRGVGKQTWAETTAARSGMPLLVVDGPRVLGDREVPFDVVAQSAAREAALQGAALYWAGFDGLLTDEHRPQRDGLLREIRRYGFPAYLAGSTAWDGATGVEGFRLLRVELPMPDGLERADIWRQALEDGRGSESAAELPGLAAKFRFTEADIHAVAADARDRALLQGRAMDVSDLYAASRGRSSRRLGEMARKILPRHGWDDLVLPADAKQQLREICDQVRMRARVFEEWGFAGKLSLGKGLHALFSGPSGTGKTMAAEIMAGELGLDMYKIDLSGIVSKYIGETEKNLARIFAEAEATSAILFFDEADALFGKRSEVKDAHDRYANVETAYLLQRMEEYEGVTLLATNLRRNMDEAFLRRLAFAVQFPFPEQAERLGIWQRVFPAAMPRADDVDLEFMAAQFKLAGGNIKNVAVAAAFLAASEGRNQGDGGNGGNGRDGENGRDGGNGRGRENGRDGGNGRGGGRVSMAHLIRATRREFQKMGRTHVQAEFGAYAAMLEG